MTDFERIPTEDPLSTMWTRLSVLESPAGATRLIERRNADLATNAEQDLIAAKSEGVAFTIRTAREYFETRIRGNLTTACVAYYYGALSLLEATLLADPRNQLTLDDVETFTRQGHGLRGFSNADQDFPASEKLVILGSGFLPRFLQASSDFDIDLSPLTASRGFTAFSEVPEGERERVISVLDFLRRIPELRSLYLDLYDQPPEYLTIDTVGNEAAMRLHIQRSKNLSDVSIEDVRTLLELDEAITLEEVDDEIRTAELHPRAALLRDVTLHSTVLADTACVRPLLGIGDVFLLEFMFLYLLSIWVRYRPALWREINEGVHSDFRAVVETLLASVARTLPNEMMNRMYGKRFLFAGFSYFS